MFSSLTEHVSGEFLLATPYMRLLTIFIFGSLIVLIVNVWATVMVALIDVVSLFTRLTLKLFQK